ncbi:MAG: serine hydrolase domain-containing protein [Candidatus Eisenbacteria bacterium]
MRTRMKIALVLLLVSLTGMSCGGDPGSGDPDGHELRLIDGTSISADEMERYVTAVMDSAGVTGLQMAIINDGRVVYTHEFGLKSRRSGLPPDSGTVFAGCSFGKPVFAYLVMQLVEDGTLDLDRPLADYLDGPLEDYVMWSALKDDGRMREITARRVLTHTTGWPNLRMQMEGGTLGFVYPPGERFSYSGEGFDFMQFVVEQVTGTSVAVPAREKIFAPLDMSRTSYVWSEAFESNHADGHTEEQRRIKINRRSKPSAGGSLVTTASDFARFVVAILNAEGLSQGSIDQMLSAQVPVLSARMFGPLAKDTTETSRPIHLSWGLGWGLFESEYGRAFFHTGHDVGWENYTVTYLNKKIGIVLLSNSSNFESIAGRIVRRAIGDSRSPFEWLGFEPFDPLVPPPPPEPERETVPIDPAILSSVVGEYQVEPGVSIVLEVRDGSLVGSGEGKYWDEVMAVSETEFFIDGKPWVFTFTRDCDGVVTDMVILYEGLKIPAKKIR